VGGQGVIAVDGFALPSNTTYYLSEAAALAGTASIGYELQISSNFPSLAPLSQVVSATLPASSQFAGYTMTLARGQTLDLRLRRAEGFSYPFNLGLYVFAPGSGNSSSSGEDGGGPVSRSANGPSIEQDGIFTAKVGGNYLILVANLDTRAEINFTLNLTLDGWELLEDTHLAGDLNTYNRADQYHFQAAGGAWSVGGLKWTGGDAVIRGGFAHARPQHAARGNRRHLGGELRGRAPVLRAVECVERDHDVFPKRHDGAEPAHGFGLPISSTLPARRRSGPTRTSEPPSRSTCLARASFRSTPRTPSGGPHRNPAAKRRLLPEVQRPEPRTIWPAAQPFDPRGDPSWLLQERLRFERDPVVRRPRKTVSTFWS